MNALRRLWVSESGQALLEVALCMPVLMGLLVGAIDLGRLSQFHIVLASMAHAGAQYGSQSVANAADISGMNTAASNDANDSNFSPSALSYYVCSGTAPTPAPSTPTMAATSSISCTSPRYKVLYVVVTATATFHPLFLYFLSTAGSKSQTAIMQVGGL